ncbi:DNA polymerase III subunit delta [Marinicauda pacifica]|uniref:DNA polymerase III subunit delta n=1 Tax=Marinicauda pacifica TaxID=1133559 RepID=UPI0035C875EE
MKVKPRDIPAFISEPPGALAVFLVFGPEGGLVRERAQTLVRALIEDPDDPFAVSRLSEDDLKSDPAALGDAMAALSMIGGDRLVRLRLSGDSAPAASWLKDFQAGHAPAEARLVIEAGDLKKGSRLRKLAEEGDRCAALACYAESGGDIVRFAEELLAEERLSLAPEAKAFFVPLIEGNRQLARAEIEKLILYKGTLDQRGQEAGLISRDDIADVCAAAGDAALDQVVDPALLGDAAGADRGYGRAMASGLSAVGVLRALQRKIDQIDVAAASGGDTGAMMRAGVPRFGPPADLFRQQSRLWTGRRLEHARKLAFDAERAVKRSGAPAEAIVGELLIRIARGAQSARR